MPRPDLKPGDFCVVETANNPANNDRWETDTEVIDKYTNRVTRCISARHLRLIPKEKS